VSFGSEAHFQHDQAEFACIDSARWKEFVDGEFDGGIRLESGGWNVSRIGVFAGRIIPLRAQRRAVEGGG
jgi:hypothetical protein